MQENKYITPYDKHLNYRKDFMDIAPRFFLRTSLMLKLLKREKGLIVDIGCGDGYFLRKLATLGYHCVGIDISVKAIEQAKVIVQGYPSCEVYCTTIHEFDGVSAFDVAVCGELLEHVEDDIDFLNHINGLLKRGGKLILSVPIDKKLWTYHDSEAGHFRRYSKEEIFKKLEGSGFKVENYVVWGYPIIRMLHLRIRREQEKRMGNGKIQRKTDLLLKMKPLFKLAKYIVLFDNIFNFTEKGVGIIIKGVKVKEYR